MGLYKRGSFFWLDYYANGRRIREPAYTRNRQKAETILAKRKTDVLSGHFALPQNEKIKFVDFAIEYMQKHSKIVKRTWQGDAFALKNHLLPFFGELRLDRLMADHVAEYRKKRKSENVLGRSRMTSTTTINRECALLRGIVNKAVEWKRISHNPLGKIPMFKEYPKERVLTEREISILVNAAKPPLKYLIVAALNTGCRKSELLNLKWTHVNLDIKRMTIEQSKGKTRYIYLNAPMMEMLSKLQLKAAGSEYAFKNMDGGKIVSFKTAWYALLKRLKMQARFHDLRHTWATMAAHAGGNLFELQTALGHSDSQTTRRYTHAIEEGQRRLMEGFQVRETEPGTIPFLKAKAT